VHGLVHTDHHPVAEYVTENLDHRFGREGLVVAQHRLNVLVPIHDEEGLALLTGNRGRLKPLDRRIAGRLRQLRVGIADVARDDLVERHEILEVVEQIRHC
jgi:hypothetical protein